MSDDRCEHHFSIGPRLVRCGLKRNHGDTEHQASLVDMVRWAPAISCAEWHCANDATGTCRRCGYHFCDAHMTERHGRLHEAEPLP